MTDNTTKEPHSISDVVDGLEELADNADADVTFGDLLDKFGDRSFAPVMLVLALIEITPVGAIPGVPSLLAACIALIAVQMLIGNDHIWVPKWIENRSVAAEKISKSTNKIEGAAEKMDTLAKGRLEFMTRGAALKGAAALIIILCITVVPLEVLPWASMGPMLAIAMISLAIMVRDGLAMLIAIALALGAVGAAVYYSSASFTASSSSLPM